MASRGIDYSKWNNIDDSDDEDVAPAPPPSAKPPLPQGVPPGAVSAADLPKEQQEQIFKEHPELAQQAGLLKMTQTNKTKGKEKRKQFFHQGQLVYEWDQTLDEVNIYIDPPPGVPTDAFDIVITSTHLLVGIKGNAEKFLNHNLGGKCKHTESFWTMEDDTGKPELHITLTKMAKGVPWESALEGHTPLDPLTATEVRKDIMRERFQEEHPGFDFSGAEFNGQVPDPSKFMGGIGYK